AGAYVLFFNYPRAAETFDKISQNAHFTPTDRREAARQSLSLYASLGDQGGMLRARGRFTELGASPKESAEADFLAASSELKKWDQFSPNEGRNAAARRDAERAMEGYYAANKNRDGAAQYLVQSAYWAAKTKYAAQSGDTNAWWSTTIHAFERWKQLAPTEKGKSTALGSYEASLAAEAEYVMLDQEIAQKFDYESGHHRFKGTPVQVIDRYKKDALEAKQWYDKLQHVTDAYVSPEWTTAAVSRQGSLYDSLRTGLYNTRPPDLRMFDAKQEALLKRAETSENPDLQEKADAIRISVQQGWRDRRDRELEAADRVVIDRYATSVVLARRYNISSRPVTNAIRRLAFLTDVIGEAKISAYTSTIKDLKYTPGMFLKMRPGLVTAPAPEGLPAPLPAFAQ
ncbi:MAG TPA: hypothetical protein VGJ84_17480, partial [Polyangiaceae bacterium]